MTTHFEKTWETYVASWKAKTLDDKTELLERCMSPINMYNDPLINTTSLEGLANYMIDFHLQIPGGHFVTNYFLAHSNKSIASWDMKNGENVKIGEGISYAEYDGNGMLISETGFFELPGQ